MYDILKVGYPMRHSEENSPPPHYMDSQGNLAYTSVHKQPNVGGFVLSGIGGLPGGYNSKEASIDQLPTRKR